MNPASTTLTLFKPGIFLSRIASKSLLSHSAAIHPGLSHLKVQIKSKLNSRVLQDFLEKTHRKQFLHRWTVNCFGIPAVISSRFLKHAIHRFASFGSVKVPHSGQRLQENMHLIAAKRGRNVGLTFAALFCLACPWRHFR